MRVFLLLFALLAISAGAAEQEKPKIELGVALGAQYLADYRGSKQYGAKALPVPFLIYRGDRIKIDRKGLSGELVKTLYWEFNVSGEVALSGGRDDNYLRRGMPELDSTFELGPSLNIALDGNVNDDGWVLRMPVRAVFGASLSGIDYVGYLFNPKITWRHEQENERDWRISSSLGITWADENYHDYYYQVDEEFVLPDRPYYDARAGFSGSYFKSSLTQRRGDWRYGVALRYDNLSGTDFSKNSPLVETNDFFSVSFLLARYFWAQ
ncbi:MipA/OmpV family protein [Agaribacterium haliotis]|uniref:MipA/OmpV family protein n=1 Tax=Agaribacterium haliotis TaxID=2013869 RepID=UPI000BB5410C|nr:MipA/OmpV family protein [Agaribacterium haliotis]